MFVQLLPLFFLLKGPYLLKNILIFPELSGKHELFTFLPNAGCLYDNM